MRFYSIKAKPLLVTSSILLAFATAHFYDRYMGIGAKNIMKTHYLGRFSIAVPAGMEQKIFSSKVRSVEIKEVVWPKDFSAEQARTAEWERFMSEVRHLAPPKHVNNVIIMTNDFPDVGRWIRGLFYYQEEHSPRTGIWNVLMDASQVGVWFKGDPTIVDKEKANPRMVPNLETIAKAYQPLDLKSLAGPQPVNRFYLQHGVINLPCLVDEKTIARFEGHPLDLTLLIEMEMDIGYEIETMGLIKKTWGLLAAALVTPGGSISKVRLGKREVAGMPGEEAVLKVREGTETDLVFTWEYNGKEDSGEYPTTRINMESPAGNLNEKLKIWDEILDSMKPMFVRKK